MLDRDFHNLAIAVATARAEGVIEAEVRSRHVVVLDDGGAATGRTFVVAAFWNGFV